MLQILTAHIRLGGMVSRIIALLIEGFGGTPGRDSANSQSSTPNLLIRSHELVVGRGMEVVNSMTKLDPYWTVHLNRSATTPRFASCVVELALNQTGPLEELRIKSQMEDTSDYAFVQHLDENRSLRIRGPDAEATVIEAPRSLDELEAVTSAEHLRRVVTRRVVTDLVLAPLQVLAGLVVVLVPAFPAFA